MRLANVLKFQNGGSKHHTSLQFRSTSKKASRRSLKTGEYEKCTPTVSEVHRACMQVGACLKEHTYCTTKWLYL